MSSTLTLTLTLVFVPLIAFGLYRRVRRTIGRQRLAPRRMQARIVVLSAVSVMLLSTLPTPAAFAAAAAGSLVGGTLAVFGLKHTVLAATDDGVFYTPNKWIGLGVTALFVGRLVTRLFVAYNVTAEALDSGEPPVALKRSALTLAFFFLLASYYAGYYALVLRKVRDLRPPPPAPAAPT